MNGRPQIVEQSQMLNQTYGAWPLPPPAAAQLLYNDMPKYQSAQRINFGVAKSGRGNWKGKKPDKRNEMRRKDIVGGSVNIAGGGGGYKPPNLNELQSQNHLKARRFYPRKKFSNRFVPCAPRNTTSFIIRAKKSGGIASLLSPSPVTPAILPTPIFSPSRELLVDMAKEEWGVDGYGSMKGLIRLRSPGQEAEAEAEAEDEVEGGVGSSDSDVEERVEVERRLDHDLSRFEMIYPNGLDEQTNLLENREDDQDTLISHLEEENLTLKERLFLMARELEDLRRRVQCLETEGGGGHGHVDAADNSAAEVSEDGSENEKCGDVLSEKSVGDGGDDSATAVIENDARSN